MIKSNEFDVEAYMRHQNGSQTYKVRKKRLTFMCTERTVELEKQSNSENEGHRACNVKFNYIALFLMPFWEVRDMHKHERPPIRAEPLRVVTVRKSQCKTAVTKGDT